MKKSTKQAVVALEARSRPEPRLLDRDFLSWSLTLLNLASYGRTHGGIAKGHIYHVAGKASSGKTFLCGSVLAEAAQSPAFDDYELIYDDVEEGALMDVNYFFGKKLANRIVPPAYTKKKDPIYSRTVSDFLGSLAKKLEAGKKVIWVEDSLDALDSPDTTKMTDNKAKSYSQGFRRLLDPLKRTGSILILVSQVRMDMRSPWGGDLITGGRALEHYPTLSVKLQKVKTLKKLHKGKKYVVGSLVSAHVTKNRISGLDRTIYFPFCPDYGIDDIGANVDFLTSSHHWKKTKGMISAPEFSFEGSRNSLIASIEQQGAQRELQVLTGKVWNEIQKALRWERKPRYE